MTSIGLLAATRDEAAPIIRGLRLVPLESQPEGRCYGGVSGPLSLTLIVAGSGPKRALKASTRLVALAAPEWLIGVGLSGALRGDLQVGDSWIAAAVVDPDGEYPADLSWMEKAGADGLIHDGIGTLLCLDRVLVTTQEKLSAAAAYPAAVAVDMESAGLARAARTAGLPWIALRCISDTTEHDLPLDFNQLWDRQGQPHLPRLLRHLARRPARLPGLLRFAGQVFHARRRMLAQLKAILEVMKA